MQVNYFLHYTLLPRFSTATIAIHIGANKVENEPVIAIPQVWFLFRGDSQA